MLEDEMNVFEGADSHGKAKIHFYYGTSILCLDLLYIIRSFLESNEGYVYITTLAKIYL